MLHKISNTKQRKFRRLVAHNVVIVGTLAFVVVFLVLSATIHVDQPFPPDVTNSSRLKPSLNTTAIPAPTNPPVQLTGLSPAERNHLTENVLKLVYSQEQYDVCGVIPKTFWISKNDKYQNTHARVHLLSLGWTEFPLLNDSVMFAWSRRTKGRTSPYSVLMAYRVTHNQTEPNKDCQFRRFRSYSMGPGLSKLTYKKKLPFYLTSFANSNGPDAINDLNRFLPKTFRLGIKAEFTDFFSKLPCENKQDDIWIFKDGLKSGGAGIYLKNDYSEIRTKFEQPVCNASIQLQNVNWTNTWDHNTGKRGTESLIVQSYVKNPLTLDGHKFHVRGLFIMMSWRPMLVVYKGAYVMVAGLKYDAKSMEKKKHVSNQSVSKLKENRLTLDQLQEKLYQQYGRNTLKYRNWAREGLERRIIEIGNFSFSAIANNFGPREHPGAFKVLATDLVVDENLEVKVIEFQNGPMFAVNTFGNCTIDTWQCETARSLARDAIDVKLEVDRRTRLGQSFEGILHGTGFQLVLDTSASYWQTIQEQVDTRPLEMVGRTDYTTSKSINIATSNSTQKLTIAPN